MEVDQEKYIMSPLFQTMKKRTCYLHWGPYHTGQITCLARVTRADTTSPCQIYADQFLCKTLGSLSRYQLKSPGSVRDLIILSLVDHGMKPENMTEIEIVDNYFSLIRDKTTRPSRYDLLLCAGFLNGRSLFIFDSKREEQVPQFFLPDFK